MGCDPLAPHIRDGGATVAILIWGNGKIRNIYVGVDLGVDTGVNIDMTADCLFVVLCPSNI